MGSGEWAEIRGMFDDLSLNARGRLPTWPGDGLGRAIHPYEESSGARGKPQIISEGHFPAVPICNPTAHPTRSKVCIYYILYMA